MPDIKCTVTECHFNSDIECHAPMIQVDRSGTSDAHNSEETKCETFKHKA